MKQNVIPSNQFNHLRECQENALVVLSWWSCQMSISLVIYFNLILRTVVLHCRLVLRKLIMPLLSFVHDTLLFFDVSLFLFYSPLWFPLNRLLKHQSLILFISYKLILIQLFIDYFDSFAKC